MHKILALLALVLAFASCTKDDQRTVNRLDGAWKVVDYQVDGQSLAATEFQNINFLFKGCDVAANDYCDGEMTTNEGHTVEFKFTIDESGENFTINFIALDLEDISGQINSERKKQTLTFTSNGKAQVIAMEPL